jgi:hypothetical protein
MANIDAMMGKIAKLIDTAESFQRDGNAEAAASYRAKAEQLMRAYRIEEETLVREAISSGAPVWREVEISSIDSLWRDEMHQMWFAIAEHSGIEYVLHHRAGRRLIANAVGYDIDLRLAEMIFNSARLAFLARMEPKFDPALSAEENIYALRGSGMDRQRVAKLVFGESGHSQGIRVGKIFRAECERRGEADGVSGRGFNPNAYRAAYADEFTKVINRRLRQSRDAADAIGGALVLPQRAERVKEALYAQYPDQRPATPEERAAAKAAREQWERDHPEEAAARKKRIEKANRWTAEDQRRWNRTYGSGSSRAREAGRSAAESVDLVREAPKTNRTGSAERTALGG